MKRSPQDQDLASLLGPSKFSADGFLGSDRRDPNDIITEDLRTLELLGVKKELIVDTLSSTLKKASDQLGDPVKISEHLTAQYDEARGKIPSPFRGDGMFQKGEASITDSRTGKTVYFTPLSINMIDKHGFFQGRGSRYRLEPDEISKMLDLI